MEKSKLFLERCKVLWAVCFLVSEFVCLLHRKIYSKGSV